MSSIAATSFTGSLVVDWVIDQFVDKTERKVLCSRDFP